MAIPPAPEGFARFVMKSKFGAGRDFRVLAPDTEAELYYVDGHIGTRPTAEVLDPQKNALYSVRGKLFGIPKRLDITDAAGEQVAHLHSPAFNFVKDKIEITMASGEELLLKGNIIEKDYKVHDAQGAMRMQITQKWVTIRDSYTVDVDSTVAPALAFALVWAIDRWVERD
ncbi:LURP-one-related/scramblase family protein [Demequina globuliformis]|uniref:LURP-one-related/scramblase family protein n=1 Tax=Demequina globuliformis TaxID=676202 RepID=UPI000781236B|nr:LURP-one-related family protein [Demequina globuliformis]